MAAGLLGWLVPAPATAAIYYVAPGGSDLAAGSEAAPWASLDQCAATLVAGDTCYVRAGTYDNDTITVANSGSAGSPITFAAYPGERPVVAGSTFAISGKAYIVIDGFELGPHTNAVINTVNSEASPSSNITVTRIYAHDILNAANDNTAAFRLDACNTCVVEYSRVVTVCNNCANTSDRTTCLGTGSGPCRDKNAAAIQAFNSWNSTARYNHFADTGEGLFIKSAPGATGANAGFEQPPPHWTFHNNYVHDVDKGVWLSVSGGSACSGDMPHKGVTIYNNLFDAIDLSAVLEDASSATYDGCRDSEGLVIYNNTFGTIGGRAINYGGFSGTNTVYNNLFLGNANRAITASVPTLIDYNVYLTGTDEFGVTGCAETLPCNSLATLQGATAFEDHGQVVADLGFIPGTFRLGPTSPAYNACRVGGVVGGAVVHCGAPADHSDPVGLAPAAPTVP